MPWDLRNDRQIWLQLTDVLKQRIVSGVYPAGVRIPSVRDLAAEAGVNPNTMQRALAALEDSGLVSAQRNAGRFVTQDEKQISEAREKMVEAEFDVFCERMMQLGYSKNELAYLLKTKGETM